MDNTPDYVVGSIITDAGPTPFIFTPAEDAFETGTFAEPTPQQSGLSIILQQRYAQRVHEHAGVAFAQVRLGAFYCAGCRRWVDVTKEAWAGEQCAACATQRTEPPVAAPPSEKPPEARPAPVVREQPPAVSTAETTPSPASATLLEQAIVLAAKAHKGQRDKAGQPYILHPLRMMLRMDAEEERVVALLHDVVEDTSWTLEALQQEGFPEAIIETVDGLTRRDGESYEAFIRRAARHPIARRVKLADLEDNMDLRRLDNLTVSDLERLIRYKRAWQYLTETPESI